MVDRGSGSRLLARRARGARGDPRRRASLGRRHPGPARPALDLDRQRRLARPRPADRVRGRFPADGTRIFVAIADVDALVPKGCVLDEHARTQHDLGLHGGGDLPDAAGEALDRPDVPERGRDRLAVVVEMDFETDGTLVRSDLYRAAVRNQAKLAYDSVSVGLDGRGDAGEGRRDSGRGGAAARPGRGGAGAADPAARGGRARSRDDRAPAVFVDDTVDGPRGPAQEPRAGAHRGLHDRRQRRDRPVPRVARDRVAPPRRPLARALGEDRRRRGTGGASACRPSPTRGPSRRSWSSGGGPIRCGSRTCRS